MSKAGRKKRKQIKSWRIEKIECRNLESKRPDTEGGRGESQFRALGDSNFYDYTKVRQKRVKSA